MKFVALFLITIVIHFDFALSVSVNLDTCKDKKDVPINGSNGSEVKRICEVRQKKTYANADVHCRKNGMNLLVIDTYTLFSAFAAYMKKTYPNRSHWSSSKGVWINGRRKDEDYSGENEDNWSVFSPTERDLDDNALDWTHGSGDCLSFIGNRVFKASPYQCSQSFYFVCEVNPLLITPKGPEPSIMNCDDIKKERDTHKQKSMVLSKQLLDKNLEYDDLMMRFEEYKRVNEHTDRNIREMTSQLAEVLTENETLKGKLTKCTER